MLKKIKDFLLVKETINQYGSNDLTGGKKVNYKVIVPTKLGRAVNFVKHGVRGLIFDIRNPGLRDKY